MIWILLVLAIMFGSAWGAESDLDTVKYVLPTQTITGTRIEKLWIDNATAVSALANRDQPTHRGLGLTDNLILVPGLVSSSRFGTDDIRLAIRGMGARSNSGVRGVRVLYDGIPESEPDGQTRLEGIEAGSLDRIEVVRGAGSSLYGNAAGGVVNLRTAPSFPRTGVSLETQGGGFGFYKVKLSAGTAPVAADSAISASFDFRNLQLHVDKGMYGESATVSLSQVKSDGWREHSAYEAQLLTGSWNVLATAKSKMRALLYINNTSAQIPGPLTQEEFIADPDQAQQRYVDRNVLRYTRKGRLGLNYVRALFSNVSLNFTPYAALKRLDRPRENNRYQLITRYILGTNAQAEWKTHLGQYETELIGGFDQQFQDGPVTWYAMENGNRANELLSQETERQWGQGYYLQWELENERSGALAGARFDRVYLLDDILTDGTSLTYDKRAVTPRAGLRYHLRKEWVAFGSVYGGFETPALSETENPFDYFVEPQKTLTVELGLRGDKSIGTSHLECEATLYTMNVTDVIVPDSDIDPADTLSPPGVINFFTNAGRAVHRGIELSAKWSKPRLGYVGLAASFGEFEFTDYVNRLGQDFTGNKVAGVSPDMINAVVRWTPLDEFYVEFNIRNYGAAYVNSANSEKADGWTIIGAAIGGRIPVKVLSASWHFGAANLTDETYVSFIQVNDASHRYYESGMPFAVFGGISVGTAGVF